MMSSFVRYFSAGDVCNIPRGRKLFGGRRPSYKCADAQKFKATCACFQEVEKAGSSSSQPAFSLESVILPGRL